MQSLVCGTPKGAELRRSCRVESAEQIHARKPMGTSSRVRERSRVTDAVISAFVSSCFATLRRAVLQRRKNTVLGRQLPLDVALRFAAPLVAAKLDHTLQFMWRVRYLLSGVVQACHTTGKLVFVILENN